MGSHTLRKGEGRELLQDIMDNALCASRIGSPHTMQALIYKRIYHLHVRQQSPSLCKHFPGSGGLGLHTHGKMRLDTQHFMSCTLQQGWMDCFSLCLHECSSTAGGRPVGAG